MIPVCPANIPGLSNLKSISSSGIRRTTKCQRKEGMKKIVTMILAAVSAVQVYAAVLPSDGSAASVQSLNNIASDGDTITMPAGSFGWAIPVTITKAIKLQGAGSGRIIGWSRSTQTFGTGTKTFTVQSGFSASPGT